MLVRWSVDGRQHLTSSVFPSDCGVIHAKTMANNLNNPSQEWRRAKDQLVLLCGQPLSVDEYVRESLHILASSVKCARATYFHASLNSDSSCWMTTEQTYLPDKPITSQQPATISIFTRDVLVPPPCTSRNFSAEAPFAEETAYGQVVQIAIPGTDEQHTICLTFASPVDHRPPQEASNFCSYLRRY
jgi:hypothetical protein